MQFNFSVKQRLFLIIFILLLFLFIKRNISKIETSKNSFEIVCDINKEKIITKKYKLKNKEIQNKNSKKLILEMINSENCLVCNLMITDNKMHNDVSLPSKKNFSFKKPSLSKVSEKKESRSDAKLDSQSLKNSKKNDQILHKSNKTKGSNSFEKLIPCHKKKKGINCEKSSFSLKDNFYIYLMKNHSKIFLALRLPCFNGNNFANSDLGFRYILKDSKEPILEIKNLNEEELISENYSINNDSMTTTNEIHNDNSPSSKKKVSFEEPQLSEISGKKESRSDAKLDSQSLKDSKKDDQISHKSNKTKESNSFEKLISCHKKKKKISCEKNTSSLKDSFYIYLMKNHSKIFLVLKLPGFNDNNFTNSDLDFRDILKDSKKPILEMKSLNEEELISENYFVDNDSMTTTNEIHNENSPSSKKKFSFEESQLSEVSKEKELGADAKVDSRPIHGDNSINHKLHKNNNKTKKSNAFAKLMVSHKEGKGIGYEEGYTSLKGNFYAYLVKDHTNMFFDVRLHYFNDGAYAANSGLGFRHALKDSNNTLGFNVYYDSRKIRGRSLFNQIGIGLEYLGIVDCRLNGYIPIQKRKKFKGSSEKDYHDGYKIIKNRYKKSLASISFEIGHHLIDYKNFKMYGAVGQYYLETGNCTMAFGGNSRLNFDIGEYVSIEFAGTYDTLFKARANGIIKIHFTWGRSKKKNKDLLKPTNHRDIIPIGNVYRYDWNW